MGGWRAGPWLAGFAVLGVGGALYAANLHDMVYVRDQLFGIAGGSALLLAIVVVVWMVKGAAARTLYREGVLVDGTVTKSVHLRKRRGGIVGYNVTVRFALADGRLRDATFHFVNQVVAMPKVLVRGDRAGLYLSAYRVGPLTVPAFFATAAARPAA